MLKISNMIKTYLPIAGAVGILFSVASWIFVQGYKKSVKDSGNITIVSDIKVMKDSVLSISRQIRPIKAELSLIGEKQVESKEAFNKMRLVVLDMASKAPGMTVQQILDYANEIPTLKKNMLYNQTLIPYRQNENLILK